MKVSRSGIGAIKQRSRRKLASLPVDRKLEALVCLQMMARDMAAAAGRPFNGIVWTEVSKLR